jgi:hypothetical protein
MAHEQVLQLDSNERIVRTVHRSLVGLIPHIAFSIFTFFGLLVAMYSIARFQDRLAQNLPIGTAIALAFLIAVVVEIVIYLLVRTYLRNLLILTNESIVEHAQITPFASNTSQLSLLNIEDVTVKQNGFFAQTFDFGTLIVQTAGEKPNFIFKFAKNPRPAAAAIISAKEELEELMARG